MTDGRSTGSDRIVALETIPFGRSSKAPARRREDGRWLKVIYQESVRAYPRIWYSELTEGSIDVVDGHFLPPSAPGFGLRLSPDLANRTDVHVRASGA